MLIQYVVGLCCLSHDPDAVDVTVGDLVQDVAAQKERDVDVTVTLNESDGTTRAFKAYEVKREGEALDVGKVEQLCAKLADMPSITHRAIVSASGFTHGAIKKAASHGVELYELGTWDEPLGVQFPSFPGVGRPSEFLKFQSQLLCWFRWEMYVEISGDAPRFNWVDDTPIFSADGSSHPIFLNMGTLTAAVLQRSTDSLLEEETVVHSSPAAPATWEIPSKVVHGPARDRSDCVAIADDRAYLSVAGQLRHIERVKIDGQMRWVVEKRVPEFKLLRRVPSGRPFAGAAIAILCGIHRHRFNSRTASTIRRVKQDLRRARFV